MRFDDLLSRHLPGSNISVLDRVWIAADQRAKVEPHMSFSVILYDSLTLARHDTKVGLGHASNVAMAIHDRSETKQRRREVEKVFG